MLLYATASSERASKSQGGNQFVKIEIQDESQEVIAVLSVHPGHKAKMQLVYRPESATVSVAENEIER